MVVNNTAKNKIRDLIEADISSMTVGTDGSTAAVSDTDLGAEITGVSKTPTISTNNKTLSFQYELLSSEANGETIKEAGVFFSDDTLFDRIVFPDYDKTAANSLVIIDVINIL